MSSSSCCAPMHCGPHLGHHAVPSEVRARLTKTTILTHVGIALLRYFRLGNTMDSVGLTTAPRRLLTGAG
jgi:hypothetical protein